VGVFGVAGVQRGLLREADLLDRGRGPSVPRLELLRQHRAPNLDGLAAGRPALQQVGVEAVQLPDRTASRAGVGSFGEPDAEGFGEVAFQLGVVHLGGGDVGLVEDASVDGEPASIDGLDLVRDRHMGVQVGVAGAAVAVGERRPDEAADVDLPDPTRPQPGVEGVGFDEGERVGDRRVMRPLHQGGGG
jgi:hypothetical protein